MGLIPPGTRKQFIHHDSFVFKLYLILYFLGIVFYREFYGLQFIEIFMFLFGYVLNIRSDYYSVFSPIP